MPDRTLVYACLSHVPLPITFPSYVTPLYLGDAQQAGQLNLRDWAPDWVAHHPILGGVAGTFALKNYVQREHPHVQRVGICQYRKFISRRRLGGVPERRYPVMDLIAATQLTPALLEHAMRPDDDFLVSRPWQFRSLRRKLDFLTQYQSAHHVEDLLRYTAQAVDEGVLQKDEVDAFFHESLFFPGGIELGVYAADFWLRGIDAIERVVRGCVTRYPTPRAGYQARAWAFCTERLGSYMLLKHFKAICGGRIGALQRWQWTRRFVGQMNVVTERPGMSYVVGT